MGWVLVSLTYFRKRALLAFPAGRRWRLLAVPSEQARSHGSLWLRQDGRVDITIQIQRTPGSVAAGGSLYLEPGDDLLSHGETPHYHRRCVVSLLSSGWGQVVPTLCGRQANWLEGGRAYRP